MLRLTSFSVEAVFPLLVCAGSLILLPQPPVAETELSYRRVYKIFTDSERRFLHPSTTTSSGQKRTFIFRLQKICATEKITRQN